MLLIHELDAGEAVIADVGKFLFARGAVEWDVTLPWRGFARQGRRRVLTWGALADDVAGR